MSRKDKSLSVRFLAWWAAAMGTVVFLCAVAFYMVQAASAQQRVKDETRTLAAVLAPRVMHDLQSHVVSYAHKTLRAAQSTRNDIALSLYSQTGAMLFSTSPVFRRAKETSPEVSLVLKDKEPRWVFSSAEQQARFFYPLYGHNKVVGVLAITRDTHEMALALLLKTALLVGAGSVIALLSSGFLMLYLRRHYFKPLRELDTMIQLFNRPGHAPSLVEIPGSEFHGELASLYRDVSAMAKGMAEAKRALDGRLEAGHQTERFQEETRFLARQIYERKMDRPEIFTGYEMLSKPVQMEQWGRLWKSAAGRARKVYFSFWSSKSEGLKAVLQGIQWDEIFQELVRQGKNVEEISDELFMEFGLDLNEWLIGQWDSYDRRIELLGNVWAGQWSHATDAFSFLKDGKPLTGSRKQGCWAQWPLGMNDKLILFNTGAFAAGNSAGLEAFEGFLAKNIRSTPGNLLDLLGRELEQGRFLVPRESFLLMVHHTVPAGAGDIPVSTPKSVDVPLPEPSLSRDALS